MAYPYVSDREARVISQHFGDPEARTLEGAKKRGRYEALKKALAMTPEELVDLVKASGLRGRGGAGFPTGVKWSFMPKDRAKPHYLCCNADESEPGTFKDRVIIEKDPHLLIEGMIISAYAIGSNPMSYIYIRGEYPYAFKVMGDALAEARQALDASLERLRDVGERYAMDTGQSALPGHRAETLGQLRRIVQAAERGGEDQRQRDGAYERVRVATVMQQIPEFALRDPRVEKVDVGEVVRQDSRQKQGPRLRRSQALGKNAPQEFCRECACQ